MFSFCSVFLFYHLCEIFSSKYFGNCTGMTMSSSKDGSGMIVRNIIHGGSISHDGRIGVGDCILAMNGEPTTDLTNAQSRALLRRHSLIGPDIM